MPARSTITAAILAALPGLAAAQQAREVIQPSGQFPGAGELALVRVAQDLADPVGVEAAPDGTGRLFVLERPGTVRILRDGEMQQDPFLDLSPDILSAFLEQGLYDIAFHPDFAENGVFFAHFAELLRNGDSVIVRYRVAGDDPDRADPESGRLILQIDQPWANHNGGELEFGPDGMLWIGSGDGGWEGDPLEAGQDLATLLGKLLRIDVSPALADEDSYRDYAIPPDNPFARDPELVRLFGLSESFFADIHVAARPEIWAYGLRNPWTFSFDPETGDLWLPDVGQNEWEEINFVAADAPGGQNFGWDFLMGSHCFPIEQEDCAEVGVLPVAEYDHSLGCSVIDIGVLRDEGLPGLDGTYLVGDYCSGTIWGIGPAAEGDGWRMGEVLASGLRITGSGRGPDGALYVTACDCHYGDRAATETGTLWKIVPAASVTDEQVTAGEAMRAAADDGQAHDHAGDDG